MATANPSHDLASPPAPPESASLLILTAAMPTGELEQLLARLHGLIAPEAVLVAVQDEWTAGQPSPLRTVTAPATESSWILTAADFVNAWQLAQKHQAHSVLLLGQHAASLSTTALEDLLQATLANTADLIVPCYDLPPRAGMVNSAILFPLTRALFAPIRFPLAIDLGLSLRMAERLAAAGQRYTASNQANALLWPVNEASAAGFAIHEIAVGSRILPQPPDPDLNAILALVTGSLFADIEARAALWQRPRPVGRKLLDNGSAHPYDGDAEVTSMIEAFRLAYVNLREIWSLVLPPNALLGLKRLSAMDAAAFRMPDNLWARIVYDFVLAYRLRTINRGHLLGALIPLYLAWVASHVNLLRSGVDAESHIEEVAAAFEAEKPYLVSRWRWPDRFNP